MVDLSSFKDQKNLFKLIHTPAMYLGSCRYKIFEKDQSIKQRIITILNKYEITDFFYIGGNDFFFDLFNVPFPSSSRSTYINP